MIKQTVLQKLIGMNNSRVLWCKDKFITDGFIIFSHLIYQPNLINETGCAAVFHKHEILEITEQQIKRAIPEKQEVIYTRTMLNIISGRKSTLRVYVSETACMFINEVYVKELDIPLLYGTDKTIGIMRNNPDIDKSEIFVMPTSLVEGHPLEGKENEIFTLAKGCII